MICRTHQSTRILREAYWSLKIMIIFLKKILIFFVVFPREIVMQNSALQCIPFYLTGQIHHRQGGISATTLGFDAKREWVHNRKGFIDRGGGTRNICYNFLLAIYFSKWTVNKNYRKVSFEKSFSQRPLESAHIAHPSKSVMQFSLDTPKRTHMYLMADKQGLPCDYVSIIW